MTSPERSLEPSAATSVSYLPRPQYAGEAWCTAHRLRDGECVGEFLVGLPREAYGAKFNIAPNQLFVSFDQR